MRGMLFAALAAVLLASPAFAAPPLPQTNDMTMEACYFKDGEQVEEKEFPSRFRQQAAELNQWLARELSAAGGFSVKSVPCNFKEYATGNELKVAVLHLTDSNGAWLVKVFAKRAPEKGDEVNLFPISTMLMVAPGNSPSEEKVNGYIERMSKFTLELIRRFQSAG